MNSFEHYRRFVNLTLLIKRNPFQSIKEFYGCLIEWRWRHSLPNNNGCEGDYWRQRSSVITRRITEPVAEKIELSFSVEEHLLKIREKQMTLTGN